MNRFLNTRTFVKKAELALIIVLTLALSAITISLDGFEAFTAFVAQDDSWELDELFIVVMFSGFACFVLLFRRARDLSLEIRRREASEVQATKLARHDPLTGLPNRRVLSEDLAAALAAVERKGAECAVLLIDLDMFKPINDVHGHVAGDAVLVEAADRLADTVGTRGTLARMGGDEFACVLSYDAGGDQPSRTAARIIRALHEPILVRGVKLQVGATIGIACAPQDGLTEGELLHGADLAMYQGKREGRSVYRFFHAEMDSLLRDRLALEADLRAAIEAGEIIPYFQPVMDLAEDTIVGFEALARWPHATRGLIPPDTFIPIAEDLGIVDQITYSMLRASCEAARAWPASLWVSVNVSPLQLKDSWLAARLLAILTETGIAPGRLVVEVTENAIIDDMVKAQAIFASLQSAGVRVALDDFGKGYSSLYHLRQLRFDQLKIDGSFVHSMESPESAKIVTAVAGLGESLGMSVTAEGVETREEADALRALGCEHGQGFLFGKPLDAAGTIALLNDRSRTVVALKRAG